MTVTVQDAVLPPLSLIAVITAVPAATATILPLGSTLATELLSETQEEVLIVAFDGEYVTVSVRSAPAAMVSAVLFNEMELTGLVSALTSTVQTAETAPPAPVTVILTDPALTPVTTPSATVAIAVFDELHTRLEISALYGDKNGTSFIVLPIGTLAVLRRLTAVGAGAAGAVGAVAPGLGSVPCAVEDAESSGVESGTFADGGVS